MRNRTILILVCMAFAAVAAHADHYASTYVIPIAGHVRGANGTWMSDVAIRNFGTEPLDVEILVIESGGNTLDNVYPLMTDSINGAVTVGVNSTVLLEDILEGHRGLENISGALVLGASRPFAVTSRAYNSAGGIGQTVPATRDFLDNSGGTIDNATVVYLPGIVQNAEARTNIGFVAGAGGSPNVDMVVQVSVRSANGGVVGERIFIIPAGRFAHYQFNLRSIANGNFDIGSADIRIVEGEGTVVPYASVVDNRTGEAAYIMGQFPNSTPRPVANSLFQRLLANRMLQVR
jgi:hypothetical protein